MICYVIARQVTKLLPGVLNVLGDMKEEDPDSFLETYFLFEGHSVSWRSQLPAIISKFAYREPGICSVILQEFHLQKSFEVVQPA